jgi:hypothetical protein
MQHYDRRSQRLLTSGLNALMAVTIISCAVDDAYAVSLAELIEQRARHPRRVTFNHFSNAISIDITGTDFSVNGPQRISVTGITHGDQNGLVFSSLTEPKQHVRPVPGIEAARVYSRLRATAHCWQL